ncbi:MAG TPA: hypothetical protein VFZ70_15075 [Euzebyales bacterium]
MADGHAYVLVHSPVAGPSTWAPVAGELDRRGIAVAVPEVTDDGSPPFWRQHVRCVVRTIAEDVPPGVPLSLAAHSGAGQLLGVLGPVLRDAGYDIAAEILADAGTPPDGRSRLDQIDEQAPEVGEHIRAALTDGGGYPMWRDGDLKDPIPDDDRRRRLSGELRALPAAFWLEEIPTAVDWPDAPVGVLVFSDACTWVADVAGARAWTTRTIGVDNHFLPMVDEARVADALIALTGDLMDAGHASP